MKSKFLLLLLFAFFLNGLVAQNDQVFQLSFRLEFFSPNAGVFQSGQVGDSSSKDSDLMVREREFFYLMDGEYISAKMIEAQPSRIFEYRGGARFELFKKDSSSATGFLKIHSMDLLESRNKIHFLIDESHGKFYPLSLNNLEILPNKLYLYNFSSQPIITSVEKEKSAIAPKDFHLFTFEKANQYHRLIRVAVYEEEWKLVFSSRVKFNPRYPFLILFYKTPKGQFQIKKIDLF